MAGQLLGEIVRDGAHVGAVDLMLTELHRWLATNGTRSRPLVGQRAPCWTPIWLDDRVSARIHTEVVDLDRRDPRHPRTTRRAGPRRWLAQLAARPAARSGRPQERAERLKARLLTQPKVASTSIAHLGRRCGAPCVGSLAGSRRPGAAPGRRGADRHSGSRLMTDEALGGRRRRGARRRRRVRRRPLRPRARDDHLGHREPLGRQGDRRRIELHVGRDLQFIRINGTVVGGLAGLAIHAVSSAL